MACCTSLLVTLLLVFITLVLQTGVVASSDFDFNAPPTTDDCLYGGRVYHPGYKFRPHHCVACHCPQKGGRVACSVEDCIEEPNCVRFANVTSQRLKTCCATCLEYGCRHTDGKMYHKGETISQDGCSRCYCPLKGGQITCDVKAKCPVALCVDLELRPGSCCPRCPNGANCQLGLRIIPRGASVWNEGALCRCRLVRRGDNLKLEAKCYN